MIESNPTYWHANPVIKQCYHRGSKARDPHPKRSGVGVRARKCNVTLQHGHWWKAIIPKGAQAQVNVRKAIYEKFQVKNPNSMSEFRELYAIVFITACIDSRNGQLQAWPTLAQSTEKVRMHLCGIR
jgi:hypothetical protein